MSEEVLVVNPSEEFDIVGLVEQLKKLFVLRLWTRKKIEIEKIEANTFLDVKSILGDLKGFKDSTILHIGLESETSMLRCDCGIDKFVVLWMTDDSKEDEMGKEKMENYLKLFRPSRGNLLVVEMNEKYFCFTQEGGMWIQDTFQQLAEFIVKRKKVSWFRTKIEEPVMDESDDEGKKKVFQMLRFLQETKILYNHSGNISGRSTKFEDHFYITPRKVNKLLTKELIRFNVDVENSVITCFTDKNKNHKTSIDSGVHSMTYERFPHINFLIHFHYSDHILSYFSNVTTFTYPCGTKEEYYAIKEVMDSKDVDGKDFAINLIQHGILVALKDVGSWIDKWENLSERIKHASNKNKESMYFPVIIDESIVGGYEEKEKVVYLEKEFWEFREKLIMPSSDNTTTFKMI